MIITRALSLEYYWQFNIQFERQDYQKELLRLLRKESSNIPLPGFRPNKIPLQLLERKFGAAAKKEILAKKLEAVLLDQLENLTTAGVQNETIKLDGALYNEEWLENRVEVDPKAQKYQTIGDVVFLKNDTQATHYTQNEYEVIIAGLMLPKAYHLDLKQYPIDTYELDFEAQFIAANLTAFQVFFGTTERNLEPTECLETLQKEQPDKVVVCDILESRYATQNFCNILIFNQLPDSLKQKINSNFKLKQDEYSYLELDRIELEAYFLVSDPHNIQLAQAKIPLLIDNFRLVSPQALNTDFFKDVKQYLDTRFSDSSSPNLDRVKTQLKDQLTISDKLKESESDLEEVIESLKSDWEGWQSYLETLAKTNSSQALLTDSKTTLANLKEALDDFEKVYKANRAVIQKEADEQELEQKTKSEISDQDLKVLTDQLRDFYNIVEQLGEEMLTLEAIRAQLKTCIKLQYKTILQKLIILESVKELSPVIGLEFPEDYSTVSQQKAEQEAKQTLPDYQYSLKLKLTLSFLSILLENHYGIEKYNDILEQIIRANFQKSALDEEEFERYRQEVLNSQNNYYTNLAQEEHLSKLANTLKTNMSKVTQKLTSPQAVYEAMKRVDQIQRAIFSGNYPAGSANTETLQADEAAAPEAENPSETKS